MTKAKVQTTGHHSPAPWFLCGDGMEIDDGSDVAIYAGQPDSGIYVGSVQTCWPCHDDENGGKDDVAEGRANARLIAAAPDLLRIARILDSYRTAGADSISFSALMHDGDDTLGQAVKAAIAKATGHA